MIDGDKLTPELLRTHANAPRTIAWESSARMLLAWAADLIEAADGMAALSTSSQRKEKG